MGDTWTQHAVEKASARDVGKMASGVDDVLWWIDSAEVEQVELLVHSPMTYIDTLLDLLQTHHREN